MPRQFAGSAAGEEKNRLSRGRSSGRTVSFAVTIQNGVSDKYNRQSRNPPGVPVLLEWENAQHQIIIFRDLKRPAFARSPYLGRNILNNLWSPIVKPPGSLTDKLPDGVSKPAIKPAEIHADDHIGLAIQREA